MAVRYWGAKYFGESGDTKPTAGSNTSGLEDGWLFVESDTDKIFVYDQSQTAWADVVGSKVGSSVQAYDAGLASIAGLSTAANKMIYTSGSDTYVVTDLTVFARTILDDADAATVRTTLGLAIGSNVQAFDAQLADVAGLAVANGNFIVGDGSNFVVESGGTARTSLGVAIGSDVQAYDADLAAIAALSKTANNFIMANGSAWVLTTPANARTGLGLVIGTNVQAYDAQLADVAGLAVANGNFIVGDGSNFVVESANTARTSLGVGTGDSPQFTGLTLTGDLTVSGTTTTINSTTVTVDDKNLELGSVASPSDTTADGGGITLKGATDKTLIWDNSNDNWTSNQDWNIASGKVFKVNNVSTLTATALGSAVVGSSLTSVGTLTSLAVSGATTLNGAVTLGDASGDTVTITGTIGATGWATANHAHAAANSGGQVATSALSGTVAINQGGTGQTTQTTSFDALSPTTTAGDVIYYNGTDNIRLGIGSATQVLKTNTAGNAPAWEADLAIPMSIALG